MSFITFPARIEGSNFRNTGIGFNSLLRVTPAPTTGNANTAYGYNALTFTTTGRFNTAIGSQALEANSTGSSNTAVGDYALQNNISGTFNTALGRGSLSSTDSIGSTGVGANALLNATGGGNTAIGYGAGSLITTGQNNTVLGPFSGNQGGLDIRTLSNYIVISDGDGNPRIWVDNTGQVNFPGGGVFPGGTANGVLYLNASGVVTSGTSLAFLPSITGASTNPILEITGTWNTTGAANGIRLNVTDTASAAGALLMDLRVGGDSKFKVDKIGNVSVGSATGNGSLAIVPSGGTWPVISRDSDGGLVLGFNAGVAPIKLFGTTIQFHFDAADTLAQRRGVNAQAFRIYNTFTDSSNYERLNIEFSGNTCFIRTRAAGTGAVRPINIDGVTYIGPAPNAELLLYNGFPSVNPTIAIYGGSGSGDYLRFNTSTLDFYPAAAASWSIGRTALPFKNLFLRDYIETKEMTTPPAAPATNAVRIYAEDNGAGKTRLMALFATGAAQQIAIEP